MLLNLDCWLWLWLNRYFLGQIAHLYLWLQHFFIQTISSTVDHHYQFLSDASYRCFSRLKLTNSGRSQRDGNKEKRKERRGLRTHCIRPRHCGPRSRCLHRTATGPGCRYTPRTHWPRMWSGSSHTNTRRCTELLHTHTNTQEERVTARVGISGSYLFMCCLLCFRRLNISAACFLRAAFCHAASLSLLQRAVYCKLPSNTLHTATN